MVFGIAQGQRAASVDKVFFSSRRRHTRCSRDWSSDVCSSDLGALVHRIVRQVELGGPDPLRQDQQQLFDLLRRQRQLGYRRGWPGGGPPGFPAPAAALSPPPPRVSKKRVPPPPPPPGARTHAPAGAP